MTVRTIAIRTAPVLAAALTVVLGALLVPSAAEAAPLPVQAGLTITPSTTTVGSTVTVVATATNTTSANVDASMGVRDGYLNGQVSTVVPITSISSNRCTTQRRGGLVYCGVQGLKPGETARITLSVSPNAIGTFGFRAYGRIRYTADDSFAYGTLTVS
jgi:hypothetical protein